MACGALVASASAGCRAERGAPRDAGAGTEPPSRLTTPATPVSTPPSAPVPGLYFGAADTPDGRRAWLVRFGPAAGGAVRLYAPPDNPELVGAPVQGRPDSLVLRSSPGLGDVYYVLTGRFEGGDLRAVIETVRAQRPADTVLARSPVTLTPVPAAPVEGAGLYSSVALNEESGDLTGEELILLPAPTGGWSAVLAGVDGDFSPYAAASVNSAQRALHLQLQTAAGRDSYEATFVPGALRLARTAAGADAAGEPSTLPLRRELGAVLATPARGGDE